MSSTKTIYTATIATPIYGAWKCPKCKEVNFSTGTIVCQRQTSSSSIRTSKHEEAKERAMDLVKEDWIEDSLGIILSPEKHTKEFEALLKMGSSTCTKCGKQPKWSKSQKPWDIMMAASCFIGVMAILIAFVGILLKDSSWIPWAIAGVCACFAIAGTIHARSFRNMIQTLPKEYLPVFGTMEQELRRIAQTRGEAIPTPEEAVEIVTNNGDRAVTTGETNDDSNAGVGQRFCRKCGTVLPEDGVCPNCGTHYLEN